MVPGVQDDILHEDLTVRENLAYSAWLRSNVAMVSEAKGEVVDDVVDLLRLRHVQVTPSPGNRDRSSQSLILEPG
jgi:ABC-type multidrug transport system ATPase subunit